MLRVLTKLRQAVAAAEVVPPALVLERSGGRLRVHGHAAHRIREGRRQGGGLAAAARLRQRGDGRPRAPAVGDLVGQTSAKGGVRLTSLQRKSAPPSGREDEDLTAVFDSVARYFSLLAEPTRLKILHAIIDTLCVKIGDEAFGPTTMAALADFGARFKNGLGSAIAESLTTRRLPFVHFADDVATPHFSYWMHDEMKDFLKRLPEAIRNAGTDAVSLQTLHRLREQWTDAVGQGPDAILVGVV